ILYPVVSSQEISGKRRFIRKKVHDVNRSLHTFRVIELVENRTEWRVVEQSPVPIRPIFNQTHRERRRQATTRNNVVHRERVLTAIKQPNLAILQIRCAHQFRWGRSPIWKGIEVN